MTEDKKIIWETCHITAENGSVWEQKTPYRINPETGKRERVKGQVSIKLTELEVLKLNKSSKTPKK
jgi:hypothetical protein